MGGALGLAAPAGLLYFGFQRGQVVFGGGHFGQRGQATHQPDGSGIHAHAHGRVAFFHFQQRGHRDLHARGPGRQRLLAPLACGSQVVAQLAQGGLRLAGELVDGWGLPGHENIFYQKPIFVNDILGFWVNMVSLKAKARWPVWGLWA